MLTNLLISWGAWGEASGVQRLDESEWEKVVPSHRFEADPMIQNGEQYAPGHFPCVHCGLPEENHQQENIVWLRSLPHGSKWPDFDALYAQARRFGYQFFPVIIVRSKIPCVASQLDNGRVMDEDEADFKIAYGLYQMLEWCWRMHIHYSLVTYEGLVHSMPLRQALCKELHLTWSDKFRCRDENSKHL
jgi:hypothetical protein